MRKDVRPLFYWIKERQSILYRKANGEEPPWTKDPILQTYRFCNVRRLQDRVSQWLLVNVLQHQAVFDEEMVFLKWVALCRWVNWPPTLNGILRAEGVGEFVTYSAIDLPGIGKFIDAQHKKGDKTWTGAYMVRAPSRKKYGKIGKGKFVAEIVVGEGLDSVKDQLLAAIQANSCQAVWEVLCAAQNWGSFMAGQVVADLTYTPLLSSASDLYTWAPMGPGSKRGYNRLMGNPLKQPIKDHVAWCHQLVEWRKQIIAKLGAEYQDLTLHDVQNCLCEVDKYLRVKNGEGRPRSKYRPETAYEGG